MKKLWILAVAGWLVAVGASAVRAQSGYDLFQKALAKERAEGNIREAIQLYQRIVREHAANRTLTAKALVQMGQCYEKLGEAQAQEARKAYARVMKEYADQAEPVAYARARLASLTPAGHGKDSGMLSRRLWVGKTDDISQGGSTDGRVAVFTDWSTGDLAAIDLATGKQRRLTNKGGWSQSPDFAQHPLISLDGKLIAYSWWSGEKPFEKRFYELRVMATAEGSEPQVLYSNPEVAVIFVAGWSRDARQLLVVCGRRDASTQIALLAMGSGELRVLKSFPQSVPGMPSLSPDGRYILYDLPQGEAGPERDIFLLARDGSREVPLVGHPAHDVKPSWTPDGSRVLFFSDRNGAMGLWSVAVAEGRAQGAPALIQANIGQASPLGFSKDGGFFYTVPSGANDLLTAELDMETGRLLSEPVAVVSRYGAPGYRAEWSPDGRYLAYPVRTPSILARGGPLRVVIRDMQTGREREMSQGFRTIGTSPKWRPDGKTVLVYGIPADGLGTTFQLDVADGSATLLPGIRDWQVGCRYPQWSTTSDEVLCQREGKIVRRRLDNGEERDLVHVPVHAAAMPLSPDGRWVAFRGQGLKSVNLVPTGGGDPREVFQLEDSSGFLTLLSWTPDSRYLLCRDQHGHVWRLSASDGAARKLVVPVKGLQQLKVHPDGKRVVMKIEEPGAEIWVMENFLPALRAAR